MEGMASNGAGKEEVGWSHMGSERKGRGWAGIKGTDREGLGMEIGLG